MPDSCKEEAREARVFSTVSALVDVLCEARALVGQRSMSLYIVYTRTLKFENFVLGVEHPGEPEQPLRGLSGSLV